MAINVRWADTDAPTPRRRRLLAGLLSFVLVIVGIVMIATRVIFAIVSVEEAVTVTDGCGDAAGGPTPT